MIVNYAIKTKPWQWKRSKNNNYHYFEIDDYELCHQNKSKAINEMQND